MVWMKDSAAKQPQLGPLENYLLSVLCHREDATVRELLEAGEVQAAYTTIMTTLDRLFKKGLLDRTPDAQGRAFRYRLKHSQQDFYQRVFGRDLDRLLQSASDPSLPVSFLVDTVTAHNAALLDELGRAVNRKRKELRRRKQL
jgi:predicted transcriptional regulator